jgi:hypothetical protein
LDRAMPVIVGHPAGMPIVSEWVWVRGTSSWSETRCSLANPSRGYTPESQGHPPSTISSRSTPRLRRSVAFSCGAPGACRKASAGSFPRRSMTAVCSRLRRPSSRLCPEE